MWHRQALHACRGFTSRRALSTPAQRAPTSKKAQGLPSLPLHFTLELPSSYQYDSGKILSKLENWPGIQNRDGHNAAVVLTSPWLAKTITNDDFMERLAGILAGAEHRTPFHILGAVVDHLAPPVGLYQPLQGLSIMRGKLDHILPELWDTKPPVSKEDARAAPALKFALGQSTLTVPGANTAFQNNQDFTLFASSVAFSDQGKHITKKRDLKSQVIKIPWIQQHATITDLDLWAPLLPMTQPRPVTASFGNIVKGVEINGASVPASTELEDAVEKVFKNIPSLAESGPIGIWAVVVPKDVHRQSHIHPVLDASVDGKELINVSGRHFEKLYSQGARVYQVLSGGGGWGSKKGLLSLDPQRTHFALSEEESFMNFLGAMEASDFAPVGSIIQFFTPLRASSVQREGDSRTKGVIFGVHDADVQARDSKNAIFHNGLFGALSNTGIFVTGNAADESKLSVPNSRICLHGTPESNNDWSEDLATDNALKMLPVLFSERGSGAI